MLPHKLVTWHPVNWHSFLVWGIWFLAFVVLELLGRFAHVPWRTLSDTAWTIELWWPLKLVIFSGLCILLVHIVFRWP